MRVTSFLLERRGYDLVHDGNGALAEAVARARADVVVFETDGSRGSSARTLAALAALPVPPGIVTIVADDIGEALPGVEALPKWASVDELARAIDSASLRRRAVDTTHQTLQSS